MTVNSPVIATRKTYLAFGIASGMFGCLWITAHFNLVTSTSVVLLPINFMYVLIYLPLFLILTVLSPPTYLEMLCTYTGAFIEWFLIGLFICWIYQRKRAIAR
jgi:hypothetical protein